MSNGERLPGFVVLGTFARAAKGLVSEEDQRILEAELIADPERGDVIRGTGGVRKMRFAREGMGKRGGLRVIYYYRNTIGRIYLITTYSKNVKDDLTKEQKNQLKALTAVLDRER